METIRRAAVWAATMGTTAREISSMEMRAMPHATKRLTPTGGDARGVEHPGEERHRVDQGHDRPGRDPGVDKDGEIEAGALDSSGSSPNPANTITSFSNPGGGRMSALMD